MKNILTALLFFSATVTSSAQHRDIIIDRAGLTRYDSSIDYNLLYLLPDPKQLIGQVLEFAPMNKDYRRDSAALLYQSLEVRWSNYNPSDGFLPVNSGDHLFFSFTSMQEVPLRTVFAASGIDTTKTKIKSVVVRDCSRIIDLWNKKPLANVLDSVTTHTYKPVCLFDGGATDYNLGYDGSIWVFTPYSSLAGKSFLIKDVNVIPGIPSNTDYAYATYVFTLQDEAQNIVTFSDKHMESYLKEAIHIKGFLEKQARASLNKTLTVSLNSKDSIVVHPNPYYYVARTKQFTSAPYKISASEKWKCIAFAYVGFPDLSYQRPVLILENRRHEKLYVKLKDFPDRQQLTNDTFFAQSIEAFIKLD